MKLVGLTGGIGSGKSTVSAMLRERGAVIVDADAIVRELQAPGQPVLEAMRERWGDAILGPDGSLDRAAMAGIAFSDDAELAALEAIVHPALAAEIRRRIEAERESDRIVVLDMALLTERKNAYGAEEVVVVDVDHETAIGRLVEQRGFDADDARRRIDAQVDRSERLAIADHVIDNSGTLERLRDQVDGLWDRLNRHG